MLYLIVAHPVAEISEVAAHEGESVVFHDVPFGISVLVETVQMTLLSQSGENLLGVAAATESYVNVDAIGLDGQPDDTPLKEYWNMVCFSGR